MVFRDSAKNADPLTGVAFGDPRPGLLSGYSAANLTNITTMSGACPVANASLNCGYKNHYTTADNGKTFYFRNCLIQSPTNGSAILIDTASTVRLYITNCRIEQNAAWNSYNGVQSNGVIGNGGSLHFIHDLFIHGPSLCSTSTIQYQCMTAGVMLEPGGGQNVTDNQILYSEFDGLSDNIRADRPTDIQWNYLHDNYCTAIAVACPHSDGIEVYRGGQSTPLTIANNYFSGASWDSSAGLNLTDDFGANGNVIFTNNKILAPWGAGWLLVVPQRCSPIATCTPPADITNVHITNNVLFAEPGLPVTATRYSLMTRFPSGTAAPTVCDPPWPNSCLTVSGNTQVGTTGTTTTWP